MEQEMKKDEVEIDLEKEKILQLLNEKMKFYSTQVSAFNRKKKHNRKKDKIAQKSRQQNRRKK